MKALLFIFFALSSLHAEEHTASVPWPKAIRDFPEGEAVKFSQKNYIIKFSIPDDPKIQSAAGSGGPIVKIAINDSSTSWKTELIDQSVGERLLENYKDRPQIELWVRGGGGDWSRCLYRFVSDEYKCVRIDDFEHVPHHNNQCSETATLPSNFHGKAPPDGDPRLFYVETRIP